MSADERLQQAVYTSPSGQVFNFIYENVSVEVDKKTTEFTFPDKDGAFIQDLGRAGRRYPFTLYFNGTDYDLEADNFLLALEEKGIGVLNHPRYGNKNVIPTGTITRLDELVTGANQAIFSVTFSETITDLTFPVDTANQENEISSLADETQALAGEEFASQIKIDNISEGIFLETAGENSANFISSGFSEFVKQSPDINSGFLAVLSSFESNVKNILTDPEGVIQQAILLTRFPSQIPTTIEGQLDLYEELTNSLLTIFVANGSNSPNNDFLLSNALVTGMISSLCEAIINAEITTRSQAIESAERLFDLYDNAVEWRDTNIVALGISDTPETYSTLLQTISITISYLISESFNLPKEIILTLQNDRNIIEFLSSVGLDIENNFDNFVRWNDLTADEIEILPMGLQVVYYA